MYNIKYEEDSEDIDFPPIKFSKDLVYRRKKKKSCLNKVSKTFKSKKNIILLIIGLIIIIISIILIVVFTKKEKANLVNNINEGIGGLIKAIFLIPEKKEGTFFNKESININKEDFDIINKKIYYDNTTLRSLQEINDIVAIDENKFYLNNDSTQNLIIEVEIQFNKILNSMEEMFKDNNNLLSIDLSNFTSYDITNLNSAFLNCTQLKEINFDNFNSEKVVSMDSTFENCISLEELNLSSFKNNKLVSMKNTFKNTESLKNLYLSTFFLNTNINITDVLQSIGNNTKLNIDNNQFEIDETTNSNIITMTTNNLGINIVYDTNNIINEIHTYNTIPKVTTTSMITNNLKSNIVKNTEMNINKITSDINTIPINTINNMMITNFETNINITNSELISPTYLNIGSMQNSIINVTTSIMPDSPSSSQQTITSYVSESTQPSNSPNSSPESSGLPNTNSYQKKTLPSSSVIKSYSNENKNINTNSASSLDINAKSSYNSDREISQDSQYKSYENPSTSQ